MYRQNLQTDIRCLERLSVELEPDSLSPPGPRAREDKSAILASIRAQICKSDWILARTTVRLTEMTIG